MIKRKFLPKGKKGSVNHIFTGHFLPRSKKGFVASALVDFWIFILFIVVVIIFFLIFSLSEEQIKSTIKSKIGDLDSQHILFDYLRTPIWVDLNEGQSNKPIILKKMAIADLITLYYIEKDENNEKRFYKIILEQTKSIFDPLEYCYSNPYNVKVRKGYAIFITEDPNEDYTGTARKKDRKFRSKSFHESLVDKKIIEQLPLPSSKVLYAIFLESSINAERDKSCLIRK